MGFPFTSALVFFLGGVQSVMAEYELLEARRFCGNPDPSDVIPHKKDGMHEGHMQGNTLAACKAECDSTPTCLGITFGNHNCVMHSADPYEHPLIGDTGGVEGHGCYRKITGGRRLMPAQPNQPPPPPPPSPPVRTTEAADL
eukprot:TRINITY_DN33844_c0_g1_i1.p2 TRINITY_DN33844_c0_g1~~TRINITY_DN33844_c0_g1_i1.p2  ORF type:complete len:142 (-),score=20.52 TRINITY_DN33844_c0_g1_i1:77-502(-)